MVVANDGESNDHSEATKPMRPELFTAKDYETRMDRFRRQEAVPLADWAEAAGMSRTQLNKYRAGKQEPSSMGLADLVRAARKITGLPVRAADLYDLGEDEPLNTTNPEAHRKVRKNVRKIFNTRIDRCLVREGIQPTRLAAKANISRQGLHQKRAGKELPSVSAIAKLVRAMRQMGRDIRAADIFDVGEDL